MRDDQGLINFNNPPSLDGVLDITGFSSAQIEEGVFMQATYPRFTQQRLNDIHHATGRNDSEYQRFYRCRLDRYPQYRTESDFLPSVLKFGVAAVLSLGLVSYCTDQKPDIPLPKYFQVHMEQLPSFELSPFTQIPEYNHQSLLAFLEKGDDDFEFVVFNLNTRQFEPVFARQLFEPFIVNGVFSYGELSVRTRKGTESIFYIGEVPEIDGAAQEHFPVDTSTSSGILRFTGAYLVLDRHSLVGFSDPGLPKRIKNMNYLDGSERLVISYGN